MPVQLLALPDVQWRRAYVRLTRNRIRRTAGGNDWWWRWVSYQHLERGINHFTNPRYKNDLQFLAHVIRQVFNISLVARGKQDATNAGAMSREYFFFQPAYGKH